MADGRTGRSTESLTIPITLTPEREIDEVPSKRQPGLRLRVPAGFVQLALRGGGEQRLLRRFLARFKKRLLDALIATRGDKEYTFIKLPRTEVERLTAVVQMLLESVEQVERHGRDLGIKKTARQLLSARAQGRALARADKRYADILRQWLRFNSIYSDEELIEILRRVNGPGIHTRPAQDARMLAHEESIERPEPSGPRRLEKRPGWGLFGDE